MPRGDGTGPAGQGPMTGRGLGYCAGYNQPGYATPGFGLGRGWGRGFGRGFGWQRFANYPYLPYQPAPQEERAMLKDEANALKEELQAIEKRLSQLENQK